MKKVLVFASAISRMLKFETLPALFMRTVLQALITHPRITSEIILTLKTLITRYTKIKYLLNWIFILGKYGTHKNFGTASLCAAKN